MTAAARAAGLWASVPAERVSGWEHPRGRRAGCTQAQAREPFTAPPGPALPASVRRDQSHQSPFLGRPAEDGTNASQMVLATAATMGHVRFTGKSEEGC